MHIYLNEYARAMVEFPLVNKLDISYAGTYQDFVDQIKRSDTLLTNKKSLLGNNHGINDTEEVLLDDGISTNIIDGVEFECLFKKGTTEYLYVFLNGAIVVPSRKFQRWSWNSTDNCLTIIDPMYNTHKLILGWYYGTKDKDYRKLAAEIIKKYAHKLKIPNEKIIIYGSSGGGCAAIYIGNYLPNSTVVAINPQIDVRKWNDDYENFESKMGFHINEESLSERNNIPKVISSNKNTKFFILFNILSKPDFDNILELNSVLDMPIVYGMSNKDNCYYWGYAADSIYVRNRWNSHSAQEDLQLYPFIDGIIKHTIRYKKVPKELVVALNRLWTAYYSKIHIEMAVSGDHKSLELIAASYDCFDSSDPIAFHEWQMKALKCGSLQTLLYLINHKYKFSENEIKDICYTLSKSSEEQLGVFVKSIKVPGKYLFSINCPELHEVLRKHRE